MNVITTFCISSFLIHWFKNYMPLLNITKICEELSYLDRIKNTHQDVTEVRIFNRVIWINNRIIVNKLCLFKHF